MAKKTLYQALQVSTTADPEVIRASYETKLASLKDSFAPEVVAERIILREAYEQLADPVRRKLYDERLREQYRALSGGGIEEARPRSANARVQRVAAESAPGLSNSWVVGLALLLTVGIIGTWVWLDHKRKVDAQRLREIQIQQEARAREEKDRLTRETVDWAKDRSDAARQAARQAAEEQRQEAMRQSDSRRFDNERQRRAQQEQMEQRQRTSEQQRAAADERRQEQENLRRSQLQLERDRRHLQELERNRPMTIPGR